MAIVRFHNKEGRECEVPWPPKDLSEIESLYHDCGCQCATCATEETMSDKICNEDTIRFSLGREVTGEELSKHAAGETLTALAKQHMQRHSGISFSDALHAVATICPGEIKTYLRLQPTDISLTPLPGTTDQLAPGVLPRGAGKEMTPIWFREAHGWTEQGARDWLKEQGFTGGDLERNVGGWVYTSDPGPSEFPR